MATYHVDPQRDPLAASSDLRRRLFGGRRRRRHAGLPLPITLSDDRNAPAVAAVHASILEDIVHYTLSNLHNIQKSLLYWKSRARATNLQRLYFVAFERGPRAFLQTARQTLGSKTPSQDLLSSSASIISERLHALTSMQDCLAAFLTELYSEVEGRFTDISSDQSLRALLAVLNTVFLKLELSLENHIFQRLPEADDVEVSIATSLIYENLLRLDAYISEKVAVHQKPRNTTIYWLPYTCGAIGLSACSLWLLRHSSFMGSYSSDTNNNGTIRDAKDSVAGYWDQHAVKLIGSIRDGLNNAFKRRNQLISTKQDVHASLHHLHQKPPGIELALAMPTEKMHDLHRKLQELNRTLEGSEIKLALCAAWPAFGLCLVLLLLLRKDGEERGRMSRLPQRLLLRDAELRLAEFRKCMANGMEEKANSKFGLMLCELDRLYRAVEFHARKTGEWQCVREDIADLAKPGMTVEDRLVVLSRLKEMYYCLLPYPSPSICYPQSV
uniref:Uncharacterized protein n=1 Tax=Avena sativa TaxID=4498 RepID=A0ACD5ZPE4_AVESA